MDGGVIDMEVRGDITLQQGAVYWIQFRAFKDSKSEESVGETQACLTKHAFAFTIDQFKMRLMEYSLVDNTE